MCMYRPIHRYYSKKKKERKKKKIHFFAFKLTAARCLAIAHQPRLDFTWRSVKYDISPSPLWRYLGFFFTPTLDFSYHVQFYTNKAFSTIRACAMLGNSVCGIGPWQRAHAYQACVLSVLTYSLPLWYATWGTGVIHLVKRMERIHSYTLGWIIGAFRTSPIGSRELIAGIPPLKVILNMRLRSMTARLLSLREDHALYRAWTLRWLPKDIARVNPCRCARHLPTDNPLLHLSATDVREQFFPHHSVARPGERITDKYPDHLFFDLTAPKRSFAYCPSDVGIKGNEQANRLTKEGAAIGPTSPIKILRLNFLQEFKRDMSKHWRVLAKSQTYKG